MKSVLLCLSLTAGLVPALAAGVPNLPKYIEVATNNNYGLDPITSVLVIEGDNITHDKAKDVCKGQNESLAVYDPADPHGMHIAVHRFNDLRTQYWIKGNANNNSYRKPGKAKTCSAWTTEGHSPRFIEVPCSKNLPVICTNSAPPTTPDSWWNGTAKPLVKVSSPAGTIIGSRDNMSFRFLSIPYAKPPTGKRRFALPVAKERLDDFKALKVGPRCHLRGFQNVPADNYAEDCLALHVFTPRVGKNLKGKALPVYVDIHGGGMTAGGNDYIGSSQTGTFATRNNMVVVTPQYRMGMLGVFEETTTYDRKTLPGNQHIHDMILALKWVQKNIAHFGGDPNRVVLGGQSSGGWSVRALISSPLAEGLFHRAIIRGDTQTPLLSPSKSAQIGKAFMEKAGCKTLDCMRKAPFERLLKAQDEVPGATGVAYHLATMDGTTVPEQFYKVLESGNFNKVPLIIVNTNLELGNGMPYPLTRAETLEYLQRASGGAAPPELTLPLLTFAYNATSYPESNWSLPGGRLVTDGFATCPIRYNALLASAHVPVRVGVWYDGIHASFNENPLCDGKTWFCHSDDNAVFTGYTQYDINPNYNLTAITPGQLELSRQIGDIVSAFARSSDEELKGNTIGSYHWPTIGSTKHDGVFLGLGEKWEDGVVKNSYSDMPCNSFDQMKIYAFFLDDFFSLSQ